MRTTLLTLLLAGLIPMTGFSQDAPKVIHLWENGAPGFESRKDEPEQAQSYWVKNIHNPSITAFLPPKEIATGAAILVIPGGGHKELVFNAEGRDAGEFLAKQGVAAFALKYRLAGEPGSVYKVDIHAKADAYRAMRYIRSHATEWGIDPNRIGVMGFSAGGELASFVAYPSGDGDPAAPDPIDRVNGKPNFLIQIYPGGRGTPDVIPKDAPPAFLLVAQDDGAATGLIRLLQKYHDAKVPVEAHIFAQGSHAFNMGDRSKLASIHTWPQRLADWLSDTGILHPTTQPATPKVDN
jgi:acetyl esterase/lipase